MESSKTIIYIVVCTVFCHYFIFQPFAHADEKLGELVDCTDVSVDYSNDPTLTREERLRLMDIAFFQSLNKFEMCQSAKEMAKTAGGVAGRGTGTGNDSGGGNGNDGAGNGPDDSNGQAGGTLVEHSVASSTMSGTELPKEYPPAEGVEAVDSNTLQGPQNMAETGAKNSGTKTRPNGKLPEDIPSADNDDALAAQIRYAAENETDSVKREQLWNEYRKYKGLAQKK